MYKVEAPGEQEVVVQGVVQSTQWVLPALSISEHMNPNHRRLLFRSNLLLWGTRLQGSQRSGQRLYVRVFSMTCCYLSFLEDSAGTGVIVGVRLKVSLNGLSRRN